MINQHFFKTLGLFILMIMLGLFGVYYFSKDSDLTTNTNTANTSPK